MSDKGIAAWSRTAVVFLMASCAARQACAATRIWNSGGSPDHSWATPANWSGALPDFDNGDGAVDAVRFNTIASGTATTLDGAKTVDSLSFYTANAISYSINGDTLTLKTGTLYRDSTAGWSTQTVNSAIVLGNNAVWTILGNHSINSRVHIFGAISDGGNGYGLTLNGQRVLALYGNNAFTGPITFNTSGTLYLNGSNAARALTMNAGSTMYLNGLCNNATSVTMNAGVIYVNDPARIPNATLVFGGGEIGSVKYKQAVTFTNPIVLKANFGIQGTDNVTLTANIALDGDRTFNVNTSRSDIEQTLAGVISDGTGGPHRLTIVGQRKLRLSGANTYTGGTVINTTAAINPVRLDGSLARGTLSVGASAVVQGTCQISFKNDDLISVAGSLNAASMKLDLTALRAGVTHTLVNYAGAVSFAKPSPLSNFLTAASGDQGWSLTDTGTSITAFRIDTARGTQLSIR